MASSASSDNLNRFHTQACRTWDQDALLDGLESVAAMELDEQVVHCAATTNAWPVMRCQCRQARRILGLFLAGGIYQVCSVISDKSQFVSEISCTVERCKAALCMLRLTHRADKAQSDADNNMPSPKVGLCSAVFHCSTPLDSHLLQCFFKGASFETAEFTKVI